MIKGYRSTREVFINGIQLHPDASLKVFNHSPDGFAWGYRGSGPAQLALALLMHFMGPERTEEAVRLHQVLKEDYIAHLDTNKNFEMEDQTIKDWILQNKVEQEAQ